MNHENPYFKVHKYNLLLLISVLIFEGKVYTEVSR